MIADPGLDHVAVDALFARHRAELLALAHMMHLKLIQLPYASRRRTLTARQREALEWVADGKTTLDVALLMGVSAAMVEKHLRLAREADEQAQRLLAKAELKVSDIAAHSQHTDPVVLDKKRAIIEAALARARAKRPPEKT